MKGSDERFRRRFVTHPSLRLSHYLRRKSVDDRSALCICSIDQRTIAWGVDNKNSVRSFLETPSSRLRVTNSSRDRADILDIHGSPLPPRDRLETRFNLNSTRSRSRQWAFQWNQRNVRNTRATCIMYIFKIRNKCLGSINFCSLYPGTVYPTYKQTVVLALITASF